MALGPAAGSAAVEMEAGSGLYVVVELRPELSGDVVDETTTVTLPLAMVRRHGGAA